MDTPFIEWLIGQAGIGGLAAMSLYLLNRSHQDSVRREKEYADTNRADKIEMMRIVGEMAKAITNLEKSLDSIVTRRARERERDSQRE